MRKLAVGIFIAVVAGLGAFAAPAAAHQSPCHRTHACPSDHHTYRWRGLLCTSYKSERTKKDTVKAHHGGRTYWCRRH